MREQLRYEMIIPRIRTTVHVRSRADSGRSTKEAGSFDFEISIAGRRRILSRPRQP